MEAVPAMNSPIRRTVLCADDEDSQLTLSKMLLEAAGFDFLGARSGAEALELFCREEIAAVILDYLMTGMKGIEIASEMKRLRPAIPIIVVSGFGHLPGEAPMVNAWFHKGQMNPEDVIREVIMLVDRSSDGQQTATPQ
jgi:DNA-binding NtrC family response regulator